jgi:hypothetical protein
MGCDVKDHIAAGSLLGQPAWIIQLAFDRFDGQSGNISPVASRTSQDSDLMTIIEQRARQIAADKSGSASDECLHTFIEDERVKG